MRNILGETLTNQSIVTKTVSSTQHVKIEVRGHQIFAEKSYTS